MTFSYDDSEATSRDQVRGKIGDTSASTYKLTDEQLDAILTNYPNVISASMEATKRLIAIFAREPDSRSALNMSVGRGSRVQQLRDLLDDLRTELNGQAQMFVGGVSQTANDAQNEDGDFVKPSFSVGMSDNDGASNGDA